MSEPNPTRRLPVTKQLKQAIRNAINDPVLSQQLRNGFGCDRIAILDPINFTVIAVITTTSEFIPPKDRIDLGFKKDGTPKFTWWNGEARKTRNGLNVSKYYRKSTCPPDALDAGDVFDEYHTSY